MPVEARSISIEGIDLRSTLRTIAFMRNDPTVRLRPGHFERATLTPEGVGTIVVRWATEGPTAEVEAFGAGARWLLDSADGLLGCTDDAAGFAPTTEPLRTLWRQHRGDRLPRTATLWHDLAWFVVQQRITTVEAAAQWRRLVDDLGEPAPGAPTLVAPPPPEAIAALGYHHFHRYGIERQRAEALRHAAHAAIRLQGLVDRPVEAVLPALRAVPGIGAWTSSCLASQTWGDADTVIVGDAGLPSLISWLLAEERVGDDARMLELLEPHRPHRARVLRLAQAGGRWPPRRHPRARRNDIRRR